MPSLAKFNIENTALYIFCWISLNFGGGWEEYGQKIIEMIALLQQKFCFILVYLSDAIK